MVKDISKKTEEKEDIAKLLLQAKAVTLNAKEPYTFASGIKSPIYCDNRILISYPELRKKVVSGFLKLIVSQKLDFDVVCGTATAGIPWASWISSELGKPLIYARGKSKDHGKQNKIEGFLKKDARVLVVEDLISSGGSSVDCVMALKEAGANVVGCVAIFTYEMKKADKAFADVKCPYYTLTDFSTLIDCAVKEKYIEKKNAENVLKWNKDPEKWMA